MSYKGFTKASYIDGKWRQALHLEPPHGWLNDPNGLCYFGGYYHVYFQYSPDSSDGSTNKCWGHYQSKDMINWEFTNTVLFPDSSHDKNGVYSGCAVVHNDMIHIFYTGNVKEDGDFDYVTQGRGANVIYVTSTDGINMSQKKTLLRNDDYPSFCSCHVRDPKVWRENGKWRMVLGARTLEDKGCVLFYSSDDLTDWKYDRSESAPGFGYMWECPDVFEIGGHKYLSISPQGLPHGETQYQNVYQSGYYYYDQTLNNFNEWDMGFDFYAPQTFDAPDGRKIIIGWMGIGDIPYTNPTAKLGYQHCLTLPREITADNNGMLMQTPVREIENLRNESIFVRDGSEINVPLPFELNADITWNFCIKINNDLKIHWNGKILRLVFTDRNTGGGRTIRKAEVSECTDIRIIGDKSSLEIFVNGGRTVMSSRFYPDSDIIKISLCGLEAEICELNRMEMKYFGE